MVPRSNKRSPDWPGGRPRSAFPKFDSYQAACRAWTGSRLKKSIAAMMRSLSSCLDATRMWRSTERASLEKKTLNQVEPGAMRGREGEFEAMCRLLRDGLATGHAHQAWNRVFGCWRRCAPATKSP